MENTLFNTCKKLYHLANEAERKQLSSELTRQFNYTESAKQKSAIETLAKILDYDITQLYSSRVFHLMTPKEIQHASKQGADIQLHTHQHSLNFNRLEDSRKSLEKNVASLQPFTTSKLSHFCYPSGEFDPIVWPLLKKMGIKSATTCKPQLVFESSHIYQLGRFLDGEDVSMQEFNSFLSGFNHLVRHIQPRSDFS